MCQVDESIIVQAVDRSVLETVETFVCYTPGRLSRRTPT